MPSLNVRNDAELLSYIINMEDKRACTQDEEGV